MIFKFLIETVPTTWRCGFVSWCKFCGGGPIWSGDMDVVYCQGLYGQFYCHQNCHHEDKLRTRAYSSIRGKEQKPDWSMSVLSMSKETQIARGVPQEVPIMTIEKFRKYAKNIVITCDED